MGKEQDRIMEAPDGRTGWVRECPGKQIGLWGQGGAGHPRVRVSLGTRGQGKAGYPGVRVKPGTQGSE